MGPVQNLYYALGEVIYAISKADGNIHKNEKAKLNKLFAEEFNGELLGFDSEAIISHILEKDRMDMIVAYNWAIKEIKINSHFLTKKIKDHFIHIIKRAVKEFPPSTSKELFLVDNFINTITTLQIDPVLENI